MKIGKKIAELILKVRILCKTESKPKIKTGRKLNQQFFAPYFFIAPYYLLWAIFGIFPLVFSLFLAFQKWSGMGSMTFVGLKYFIHLLFYDVLFWKSLYNTGWLLIFGSISQHFIAIPLAITLNNRALIGRESIKTAFFMPYITSSVSVALIFQFLFGYHFGLLNYIFNSIGLPDFNWLNDKNVIKSSIAIVLNWRYIGWNTVIYLAGLQAIPVELYESADIDGAGAFRKHWNITIPLLLPIIFFTVTLSIIGGMQLFDDPFILTGGYGNMGGTANAGFTSAYYIMWLLQKVGHLGKGSSISWLLFLIILVMTAANRIITNRLQGPETERPNT